MKSNHKNRLTKIEKEIEKKLNPDYDKEVYIIVLTDKGETPEQKLAEKEKELGHKIKKNKAMFVCISGIDEF